MKRLLLVLAAVVPALLVPARPTSAHAVLRASQPLDREVMPEAPDRVLLRFSESVAVSASSIRVLDHHGDTVVGRGAAHLPGDDSQVQLKLPELEDGTYIVAWRVVSADSHPAVGALSFRIGKATDDFHVGESLLQAPRGDRTVGLAFGVVRFVLFGSVILLVGSAAFLLALWPEGRRRPGARRLVGAAWATAVVATVAAVALQGAYAAGGGLADAVSPTAVTDVLRTRYGDASLGRLILLLDVAVVVLALAVLRPRRLAADRIPLRVAAALAAVALLASISWTGHASTGRFVRAALALDVVHLAAVSVWLGGLATLVTLVLRRSSTGPPEEAGQVARRFSRIAFGAVVVIVATGTLQSWRQLASPGELTSTVFGRLLLAKVIVVAGMLAAAWFSRRLVRRPMTSTVGLSPGPGAAARTSNGLSRLRRWVAVESAMAVVVIGVTAGLVNAVPARQAAEVPGPALPFSAEMVKDGVRLDVTLEPARTGLDDLHVYVISDAGRFAERGRPIDALEVTATLRLKERDTGPIKVPLVENAPGHWSAFGFLIPIAGTWQLEVAALVSEIDLVRVRSDVSIR